MRQGVKRAQKVQKVVKSAKRAKKCKKCSEVQKVAKSAKRAEKCKSVKVMKSIKIPLKWTRNSNGLVKMTKSYQNSCKNHKNFGFLWNFIIFRNFRISRFLWKWIAFYDFYINFNNNSSFSPNPLNSLSILVEFWWISWLSHFVHFSALFAKICETC